MSYLPDRFRSWLELCKVAPALNRLHNAFWPNQKPPPKRMHDAEFLRLAASFNDPVQRDALRQLIVDLLRDNDPVTRAALRNLILEVIKDDLAGLLTKVLSKRPR